jgi:hypothetical protein
VKRRKKKEEKEDNNREKKTKLPQKEGNPRKCLNKAHGQRPKPEAIGVLR